MGILAEMFFAILVIGFITGVSALIWVGIVAISLILAYVLFDTFRIVTRR